MVQASQPDTNSSTPIPWTTGGCVIYGGDGESVADLVAGICNHNGLTPDQTEANAAFIVRAVNNHAKLLKALVGLLAATKAGCRGCPACGCGPHEGERRHYEPCSVTIAEAVIEEAQS